MRKELPLSIGLVCLLTNAVGQSYRPGSSLPAGREASGYVRLHVANAAGTLSDEALVIFHSGNPATDGEDVLKYSLVHATAPRIATMGDGSVLLAINAYGPYTTEVSIPVMLRVATTGTYSLTMTGLDGVGLTCLTLEDPIAGTSTALFEGSTYTFSALAAAPQDVPRFTLHGTAPIPLAFRGPTCSGSGDGMAAVDIGDATAEVSWAADGQVLAMSTGSGLVQASELSAGAYQVNIQGLTVCAALHASFELADPPPLVVQVGIQDPLCAGSEGSVSLSVEGGVEPYTVNWSNLANGTALHLPSGSHTVEVSDANGCVLPPIPVEVGTGIALEAILVVDDGPVAVGAPVPISSGSDPALAHNWDLGDGSSSTELALEHAYSAPGSYTVTLTVSDGTCSATTSTTVQVGAATAVAANAAGTTRAWYGQGAIQVEHAFSNSLPVHIRLLNATGQLVREERHAAIPARITLANAPLATGVWFVQVSNGSTLRTFRIPVAL